MATVRKGFGTTLAKRVAERTGIPPARVKRLLRVVFEEMLALLKEKRIGYLPLFGTIKMVDTKKPWIPDPNKHYGAVKGFARLQLIKYKPAFSAVTFLNSELKDVKSNEEIIRSCNEAFAKRPTKNHHEGNRDVSTDQCDKREGPDSGETF